MVDDQYEMPTSVPQLIRQFLLGDLSPANQRVVTAFWFRVAARGAFLFFMAWALGWLTWAGLSSGFARADDVERKLKERMAVTEAEVKVIKEAQLLTAAQVASILRLNLERELHRLAAQYCKAEPNTPHRVNITRLIRNTQDQYRDINDDKPYTIPDCEDL